MSHQPLAGKKIVITGASSGIGRATSVVCAQLGAQVVLIGRNVNRLCQTRDVLEGEGHLILAFDLTAEEKLEGLFERMLSDEIKLDGLVHCAGVPCVMPLKGLTSARLHEVMNINFYCFVELVRQFVKKKYSNDGASVVGMSAALVSHPRPYELGYIASKAALEAAVQVMALENGKRKIRVNCVSPGAVKTEMVDQILSETQNEDLLNTYAHRAIFGWQSPESVGQVCAFLLSDAASSITARTIQADGGLF